MLRAWLLAIGISALILFLSVSPSTRAASVERIGSRSPSPPVTPIASDRVDGGVTTASRFGVQTYDYSSSQLAGATWLRVDIDWAQIETSPGVFNWTAYDTLLANAHAAGYQVIGVFRNNPSWLNTSANPDDYSYECRVSPDQLGTFATSFRAIVSHYSAEPYGVHEWEIYNEPDSTASDSLDAANFACFGATPGWYASVLQTAYPIVKAADPNNVVLFGGLALDWFLADGAADPKAQGRFAADFLSNVLSDGGGSWFDVMAIHYYPNWRVRWDGLVNGGGNGLAGGVVDVRGKVAWVRAEMARHGVSKPVAVTEISAWSNLQTLDSTDWQARYLVQSYSRAINDGVQQVIWFDLADSTTNTVCCQLEGLFDGNGNPKPADGAMQVLTSEVGGATYVRQLGQSDTGWTTGPYDGVEGYEFRGMASHKRVWILWSFLDVCSSEPYFSNLFGKTDSDRRTCAGQMPTLSHDVTVNGAIRVLTMAGATAGSSVWSPPVVHVGLDPVYVEFDDTGFSGLPQPTPIVPNITSDWPPLATPVTATPTATVVFTASPTPLPTQVVQVGDVSVGHEPDIQPTVILTPPPANVPDRTGLVAVVVRANDANGSPLTSLSSEISVSVDFSSIDLTGLNPALLQIYTSEDGQIWTPLPTKIDPIRHVATTSVQHLSLFALVAPVAGARVPQVFVPVSVDTARTGW